MMCKLITDFKLQFHLSTGTTSSFNVKEVTHVLLPFLMQIHTMLPDLHTFALLQLLWKINQQPSLRMRPKLSVNVQILRGFIPMHSQRSTIVNYYKEILNSQLRLH